VLEGAKAASDLDPLTRAVTWNQAYTVHQYTFLGDWRTDELARWQAVSEGHDVPLWVGKFGIAAIDTIADSVNRYDDGDGPVQGFALWSWKVEGGGVDHPCLVTAGDRWRAFADYLNRGGAPPARDVAADAIADGLAAFSTCTIVRENARALGSDVGDIDDARAHFSAP
jgi:hypothetical protein